MPANQIIKGLYIGDIDDAHAARGKVDVMINVLERPRVGERVQGELWMPIAKESEVGWMEASVSKLDKVAATIDKTLKSGKSIMIHCTMGMERSPLSVIWYLYRYKHIPLAEAYIFVKDRRWQTKWCLDWLPRSYGII